MIDRSARNTQLLSQLGERNPFRKTAPAFFDISAAFAKNMEAVGANRKLSPEGCGRIGSPAMGRELYRRGGRGQAASRGDFRPS